MRYIANDSGGKDSRCMVHMLIGKGYPLDEVVYFNNDCVWFISIGNKALPLCC